MKYSIFFLLLSFNLTAQTQCVKYMGYQRFGMNQISVRFYNGCPQDMRIDICITDGKGSHRLYKSGNRVVANGSYQIYLYEGLKDLAWTTHPDAPPMPGKCAKSSK